jgi:hypothetical protein
MTISAATIRSPQGELAAYRKRDEREATRIQKELETVQAYLGLSTKVTDALEALSQQLFRELLGVIEDKLTIALQEVLEQPIRLKAEVQWKHNAASVDFWVERDGNREDILKGQGGSVANILSVGLRMFALMTLDPDRHRRFLVLDEQDCWLRPELVPRLVKIVSEAGKALGFQTLMISHHDSASFAEYADRMYRVTPQGDAGVDVSLVNDRPNESDDTDAGEATATGAS